MKKLSFVGGFKWMLSAWNVNRVRGLLWNNPLIEDIKKLWRYQIL
jgi:hypothetical protein